MGNKFLVLYFVCLFFTNRLQSGPENFCGIQNKSTFSGERLHYQVFYSLAGIYVNAGEAVFTNQLDTLQQKPVYHVSGIGRTHKNYEWIYKVNDVYDSYLDTSTMLPLKFKRNVRESGTRIYNHILFNHGTHTAVSTNGVFKIPDCVQDVLSSIYYARNLDFSHAKNGDLFPFQIFLDDQVFPVYIRYMGKKLITTKFGTFRTIQFKPKLIQGTLFKGGEQMTVYVTDDENKIPVLIETPILVGTIKVELDKVNTIRHTFNGKFN